MISEFCFLKKLGKYTVFDGLIGEGAFSSVYLVKRISDGGLYALKKVNLSFGKIFSL